MVRLPATCWAAQEAARHPDETQGQQQHPAYNEYHLAAAVARLTFLAAVAVQCLVSPAADCCLHCITIMHLAG
jgi:hypothetical protein